MGPLQGIKVVDLTRILAGPWATQALADYGAEVWKIERPQTGDDTRHWGPPFITSEENQSEQTKQSEKAEQVAAYFLAANRGKHSITLDISNPHHQEIIKQLIAQADVLVENFKVGGLAKYGLDYDSVKQIKPDIIYCSITGFGQTGPDADKAGYDAMIQARGGLMSITGEPAKAQKAGVAIADLTTGMYALSGILAALYHRTQTGVGQYIDLALLDTQVAWLANQNLNYLVTKEVPARHGTAHPNIVPYQSFMASDGEFMLAVGNDRQFIALCKVLGIASVAFDSRYATNSARVKNRSQLLPILQREFLAHPCEFWLTELAKVKVACGPINDLREVFADSQVKHRKMQFDMPHEVYGEVPMVANPVKFSQTPIDYHKPPPALGADTKTLLASLGIAFAQD